MNFLFTVLVILIIGWITWFVISEYFTVRRRKKEELQSIQRKCVNLDLDPKNIDRLYRRLEKRRHQKSQEKLRKEGMKWRDGA